MRAAELAQRLGAKRLHNGEYLTHCPLHDDHDPSCFFRDGTDCIVFTCFPCGEGCSKAITEAIAHKINAHVADFFWEATASSSRTVPHRAITVEDLATVKALPASWLRERCRLEDLPQNQGVKIPYFLMDGTPAPRWRKRVRLRATDPGSSTWGPKTSKRKPVPYGLWKLDCARAAGYALVVEGETCTWTGWYHDVPVIGLPGCGTWRLLKAEHLAGIPKLFVVQEPGKGGTTLVHGLAAHLATLRWPGEALVVVMPDGFKDVNDLHRDDPSRFGARLQAALNAARPLPEVVGALIQQVGGMPDASGAVSIEDFYAYMPQHNYIYVPTRTPWPGLSVDRRVQAPVAGMTASAWLDKHRPVEQMTWAPGEPELIHGRLIDGGGWIEKPGVTVFNLYLAPRIVLGDPTRAEPWLAHVRELYPNEAEHLIAWLAHRVQRPAEKINHALVLGGLQGIGKDTLLEPVKYAVGPWNMVEVSPLHMMGRFNGHLKSIILRLSEARDLGEVNRYAFYDHMKTITASPPDVLRVDEKNLREYTIPNVCSVIMTTNHKTDGIYLPADDRRHYVAWSEKTKEDFTATYWRNLWTWYADKGVGHVAAYLTAYNLAAFDPKAPPPKTEAFSAIVDASGAPESAYFAEALDTLGNPDAVTVEEIDTATTSPQFHVWLQDPRNGRAIPHRLEDVGYVAVLNRDEKRGRWTIGDRHTKVYVRKALSLLERYAAAVQYAARKCR
jgi:hypothetical protein